MFIKLFNHSLELNFRARRPFVGPGAFVYHKYDFYSHLVYGRLSMLWGQPHLEPVLVHKGCGGMVEHIGPDGLDYCQDCEHICEGDTEEITLEQFENQ